MRTRYLAAAAITAALLALTACSSPQAKPAPAPTVTVTATPSLSQAQHRALCVDAVADLEPNANGEIPSEPVPTECQPLSERDYIDAYMRGILQRNQENIDELNRRASEEAAIDGQ